MALYPGLSCFPVKIIVTFANLNHFTSRMSRFLIFFLPVFMIACSINGNRSGDDSTGTKSDTTGEKYAVIEFERTEYRMEKVVEGEKVGCQFIFHNTGTADLIIQNATASCGCTVPRWDKEPVKPGGKGTLEVIFDSSGRTGLQEKSVTVYSNATEKVSNLTIIAEITSN
jgi:hypothetical protein